MNTMLRKTYIFIVALTLMVMVGATVSTYAQRTNNRVSDAAISSLIQTLERDVDYFNRSLTAGLDRSNLNGTASEDEIVEYVRDFENATDRLKQNFDARNSASADVQEILNRAANI